MSKANLFVVSAPSGAGKTTVVNAALERLDSIARTVSHTTRQPRGNERDGVDYHFVDMAEFQEGLANDHFAEHAEVFGRFYGTSTEEVEGKIGLGRDAVAVIDWQGARSMRARYPESITIFIVPPSLESLRQRLTGRGEDAPEEIERRLSEALSEASHYREFDYVLVNDDLDEAVDGFIKIVEVARMHRERRSGVGLLADLAD
ncbi:MAG: guanylate kinase [Gammaproteobacteria bacterium]